MNAKDGGSNLLDNRLWQPTTIRWFAVMFGAALAYAIVRYHIAGDVAWDHFPLFILNKATALAAVMFVACSYLVGRVFRWHNDNPRLKLVIEAWKRLPLPVANALGPLVSRSLG